jgi:hypothetical protein
MICIVFGSWIRIRIKVKIQERSRLKNEAWRLKTEASGVCRLVVTDSHHLDED